MTEEGSWPGKGGGGGGGGGGGVWVMEVFTAEKNGSTDSYWKKKMQGRDETKEKWDHIRLRRADASVSR